MINQRDVIRMKVPYPNISADLAVSSHMYICKSLSGDNYEYVKCQTLKPKMLGSGLFKHFIDETADVSGNPFTRTTRIDCDKIFATDSVRYNERLKTTIRPDVCCELYNEVLKELETDGYDTIEMDADELTSINPMITKIEKYEKY